MKLDILDVLVKTGVNIRELVIEANVSLCVGVSVLKIPLKGLLTLLCLLTVFISFT